MRVFHVYPIVPPSHYQITPITIWLALYFLKTRSFKHTTADLLMHLLKKIASCHVQANKGISQAEFDSSHSPFDGLVMKAV